MNIEKLYHEVVTGNKYDLDEASKHNVEMINANVKACDLPLIEATFIAENHVGCCLHYGMALFHKLRNHNIECYIAITKEENPITHEKTDNHVSVLYTKDGKELIADPVETVKNGAGNFYNIPVERFQKEQDSKVWIFDPYGEYGNELFFGEFLSYPIKTLEEGE